MLSSLSTKVRIDIATARALAIRGDVDLAISLLRETERSEAAPENSLARVACWLQTAEFLHWEHRDEEALELFSSEIDPLLGLVQHQFALVAEFNRCVLAQACFKDSEFYNLVDLGKVAGVRLWRDEVFWQAHLDALAGKRYESLPAIWGELKRVYEQGHWPSYERASGVMAKECVALGFASDAAYHAVLSKQEDVAKEVASQLIEGRNPEHVRLSTEKALECGTLYRHFLPASTLLESLADLVPDDQTDKVVNWVLKRTDYPDTRFGGSVPVRAWRCLRAFCPRLTSAQAYLLVRAATTHPAWTWVPDDPRQVNIIRIELVKTVVHAAPRLSASDADSAIELTVPLATTGRGSADYGDCIEALCQLAMRGTERGKATVRAALYAGQTRLDPIRFQVAHVFDQHVGDARSVTAIAAGVADEILRQVQWVTDDSEAVAPSGTIMKSASTVDGRRLVVHHTDTVSIVGVLRRFAEVEADERHKLLDALISLLRSSDNVVSNRIGLAHASATAANAYSEQEAWRLIKALEPLAQGDIVESRSGMTAAEAKNPLNPYRMNSGEPEQLRAIALQSLAKIAAAQTNPDMQGRVNVLIERGLGEVDPTVRLVALNRVAQAIPTERAVSIAAVLTGDSDPKVAAEAFYALSGSAPYLSSMNRFSACSAIRHASQSKNAMVRRAAAHCAASLSAQELDEAERRDVEELVRLFASDVAFSVRQATRVRRKDEAAEAPLL